MPPDVLPEKVAVVLPVAQWRSARSIALYVLKPDIVPVNAAVRLWSNVTVPLAPDEKSTFSESAAPSSRLPVPERTNEPVPAAQC